MSFPDLPAGYDRHRAALQIVDPGACNPSDVALALHTACRQAIAEGSVAARGPGGSPDRPPARLPAQRRPHPRYGRVRPAARTLPRPRRRARIAPPSGRPRREPA